jgi:hypothetical protein
MRFKILFKQNNHRANGAELVIVRGCGSAGAAASSPGYLKRNPCTTPHAIVNSTSRWRRAKSRPNQMEAERGGGVGSGRERGQELHRKDQCVREELHRRGRRARVELCDAHKRRGQGRPWRREEGRVVGGASVGKASNGRGKEEHRLEGI